MLSILVLVAALVQEDARQPLWEPAPLRPTEEVGTLRLQVDNDLFTGTDQHYTSGWTLAWDTRPAERWRELLPPALAGVARWIPGLDQGERRITLALTQILVTPEDIEVGERIEDDAPYAGALLLSLSMSALDRDRLNVWQFTAGLVGPSAGGKGTQKTVHEIIHADEPRGWDHQLEDEFVLNVHYVHKRRFVEAGGPDAWSFGAGGAFQVAAGNLVTHASAGLEMRGGWRMPSGFEGDPDGLRTQFHGYEREGLDAPFGIHAFASIAARVWANTIFLDGNTFRDSHEVDKNTWMLVAGVGVSARAGRWRATLEFTLVSDPIEGSSGYDGFGALDLAYAF